MRLSDAKIKDTLVHADQLVRQEALQYFTGSYSRDTEVMPFAILAIAKYGHRKAFLHAHHLRHLVQTGAISPHRRFSGKRKHEQGDLLD